MIHLRQTLSVFAAGFLSAVAVGDEPVQWSTAEGGNGHWYARYPAQSSFVQMLSNAMAIGGNLASVTSAEENAFLAKLAGGVPGAAVYFGARSVAGCPGNFEWTDGSPWEYTNWGANQPMCYLGAPVGFEGDKWYDIFNYGINAEAVIVEWSADCNGDGIVDYGLILDGTFPDANGNGVPDCCDEVNCDPTQWALESGGNGHWYQAVSLSCDWETAYEICIQRGGHLATPTSEEENLLTFGLSLSLWYMDGSDGRGPWLGGYQLKGSDEPAEGWTWVTDESWVFTSWDCANPDNSGGGFNELYLDYSTRGFLCGAEPKPTWNDANANRVNPGFIIEWSADCNDDGIVDYGQILDGTFPDENENGIPDSCEEINRESVQWRVELGGNGHWYRTERSPGITWEQANIIAESTGGHLATPTTDEENTYLYGMIDSPAYWIVDSYNNASGPYLGAVREAGAPAPDEGWYWVSGEPWEFTAWAPIQPNNANGNQDRMHFWNGTPERAPGWNDISGGQSSEFPGSFIIEWSADCNNDGIVDHGQILDGSLEDLDTNGIPDCCELDSGCSACLGDITENGTVDAADLGILLALWGTDGRNNPLADINVDGHIDGGDLGLLLFYWGACP